MQPQQPMVSPPQNSQPNYDFIINPEKPAGQAGMFSGSSVMQRLLIAGGGLVVLIIVASIVIKLMSSTSSYFPSVLAVVQEQQQILHITQNVTQSQTKLSTTNANLAQTLQLTVSSSQGDLLTYLQKNGHKVSAKQLNLKINPALDTQLNTAAQAGTYDNTFAGIMQTQLSSYQQYLAQAYQKDKGPIGQKLLKSDYQQAQLLLAGLNPDSQT